MSRTNKGKLCALDALPLKNPSDKSRQLARSGIDFLSPLLFSFPSFGGNKIGPTFRGPTPNEEDWPHDFSSLYSGQLFEPLRATISPIAHRISKRSATSCSFWTAFFEEHGEETKPIIRLSVRLTRLSISRM